MDAFNIASNTKNQRTTRQRTRRTREPTDTTNRWLTNQFHFRFWFFHFLCKIMIRFKGFHSKKTTEDGTQRTSERKQDTRVPPILAVIRMSSGLEPENTRRVQLQGNQIFTPHLHFVSVIPVGGNSLSLRPSALCSATYTNRKQGSWIFFIYRAVLTELCIIALTSCARIIPFRSKELSIPNVNDSFYKQWNFVVLTSQLTLKDWPLPCFCS